MNRLQQANLTARPTKCVFGAKSVEFLGHQVGFDWITVNDDNLEKIRMAQRPTTKKEVRSFLGLVNYYPRSYSIVCCHFGTTERPYSQAAAEQSSMGRSTGKRFSDFARTPTEKAHFETSRSSKTVYLADGRFKLWTRSIAYARAQ